MRIAVDAMGSDNFPKPDVAGSVEAARAYGDTIILVGDEKLIRAELAQHQTRDLSLEVLHTPEYVTMSDPAAQVGRNKPQSSMHLASQLVKEGKAEAFVTAGNTGAAMAITTLHTLKRLPGVKRPTLMAIMPLLLHPGRKLVMTDIGANADCQPEWILQFAQMGSLYAEKMFQVAQPKVGLLANGEEEEKGTQALRDAHHLLAQSSLNFVGNVEPKDVLRNGAVDVVVSDGFAGNIFMKTIEAVGGGMAQVIRQEIYGDWRSKIGGWLAMPAFRRVAKAVDPFEIGGTLLLGVNGVVIIGHGRTNALGIKNCIRLAREAVQSQLLASLQQKLSDH